MHKLIRTYPTRSVKLARPRPLGAKLAEKDSTGRENLRRKNVKLEKLRHWNLPEFYHSCCQPQLCSPRHQQWPRWAAWTPRPLCLQIQETGEGLHKIWFLKRIIGLHKMSNLSSLEICFDHKKPVVVEISNHSLHKMLGSDKWLGQP